MYLWTNSVLQEVTQVNQSYLKSLDNQNKSKRLEGLGIGTCPSNLKTRTR